MGSCRLAQSQAVLQAELQADILPHSLPALLPECCIAPRGSSRRTARSRSALGNEPGDGPGCRRPRGKAFRSDALPAALRKSICHRVPGTLPGSHSSPLALLLVLEQLLEPHELVVKHFCAYVG